MRKIQLDLSERSNAVQTMNKTSLIGVTIMNAVLALA